jgi:hypothetical protein
MDSIELQWRKYEMDVSLYRSYLEFVIKFNVLYYAITGALVSYYFANQDNDLSVYGLVLPLLMSVGFAAFFLYGAGLAQNMRASIMEDAKSFGFTTYPEVRVLQVLLLICGLLFIVAAGGLGFLLWIG